MQEIDREKFGAFVALLRKEKGLTQKELAQRLLISDKAVSKWERGLSMPDIALLLPLSELLGVSITQLLCGERVEEPAQLPVQKVDALVTGAIHLSCQEEQTAARRRRRLRGAAYAACVGMTALELLLLLSMGYSLELLRENLLTVELLCLLFGGWFCLLAKERLPVYYDENSISAYSDGVFRMNLAGIRLHNGNWPHILRAGRVWMLAIPVLFPLLYGGMSRFFPGTWESGKPFFILLGSLGIFVPIVIAGKRYE